MAICARETQATTLPLTSAQGAWTKEQFDMLSNIMHAFCLSPTVYTFLRSAPNQNLTCHL